MVWERMIDDDKARRGRKAFGLHEVVQDAFEETRAVEEDQVRRGVGHRLVPAAEEEVAACGGNSADILRQALQRARMRADTERGTMRERQEGCIARTDFQTGPRLERPVQFLQDLGDGGAARGRFFLRAAGDGGRRGLGFARREGASGKRRCVLAAEDAHKILPGAASVAPDIDEFATGIAGERAIGIRIEAVAIDRVAVFRPGGGRDQEDETRGLQYTDHFREALPEELAMFEHLPAENDIDRSVLERNFIGTAENEGNAFAGRNIRADIVEARGAEEIAIGTVQIGTAEIENERAFPFLQFRSFHETPVTSFHVLHGSNMHFRWTPPIRKWPLPGAGTPSVDGMWSFSRAAAIGRKNRKGHFRR